MTAHVDFVVVHHNEANRALALLVQCGIASYEPLGGYRFITVDNSSTNRGFAKACNLGAFHPDATAPIIGFLNPDVTVDGPLIDAVRPVLQGDTVITGERFAKPDSHLQAWGVTDWVCGAAMFVQRPWFESVGGFDEQFVWAWEETDLIRQAQAQGLRCRSISLPIRHASPEVDSEADTQYKRVHFEQGQKRFYRKWGRP